MAGRAMKIDPKSALQSNAESIATDEIPREEIARRAYELWQARGCPIGSEQEDWLQAESELRAQNSMSSAA